jgi:2-keto-3-deoxy-L-rhamnonate aldolase RhmA
MPQRGTLARGFRAFCRIPGCFARSSNDSRFLDSTLRLRKYVAHMSLENVEAIAAVEGIDMIAYGHSDLGAPRC